jgi:polysaccharide biosynthesis protein PslG
MVVWGSASRGSRPGAAWRRWLLLSCMTAMVALTLAMAMPAPPALGKQRVLGAPVPSDFVGVNIGGPLLGGSVNLSQQFDQIVAAGVQTVRAAFNWAEAQPYRSWADVPADEQGNYVDEGGVPTSYAATDQVVAAAAAHGLSVLPTVVYAPSWDAGTNRRGGLGPPADPNAYGNYLRALVARYGPQGTFWQTHGPRRAIREWQVWNEPNLWPYWPQPFASSYVKLLRVAHAAIKAADPGAKLVLGALANAAWKDLGKLYRVRGARTLFDVVAVNGFTATPGREVLYLRFVRRALARLGGARKPLLASEISWPSALGAPVAHHDWDTSQRGQARDVAALLPMLAAARASLRLSGFYYYTWLSQEGAPANDFSYAGLLRYEPSRGQVIAKPALAAYRTAALRIEGCKAKGRMATVCVRR